MNKRANAVGMGIIVSILLLCVFAPYISNMISNADNVYECQDAEYPIESANGRLCTNATYGCCGTLKTMNISFAPPLCTNSSGVLVANQTACNGLLLYNETSTDIGMTGAESSILRLTIIFLVLGLFAILVSPLLKKK